MDNIDQQLVLLLSENGRMNWPELFLSRVRHSTPTSSKPPF